MATTQLQNVMVQELTKFGFKANGEYINWSKTLDDSAKTPVVPGRTFNMELYIADSGKKYVNKVLGVVEATKNPASVIPVKAVVPVQKVAKSFVAKAVEKATGEAMTRADWDNKDQRISRQGVIQASVQAIANLGMVDLEHLYTEAEVLANQMLEFVNRK